MRERKKKKKPVAKRGEKAEENINIWRKSEAKEKLKNEREGRRKSQ